MVSLLPKDIWIIVFRFLDNDKYSIGNCMQVCKAFNSYINNSRELMIRVFLRDYHVLESELCWNDKNLLLYIKRTLQKEKNFTRNVWNLDVKCLTKIPLKRVNNDQIFRISLPRIPEDKCIFDFGMINISDEDFICIMGHSFLKVNTANNSLLSKLKDITNHFNIKMTKYRNNYFCIFISSNIAKDIEFLLKSDKLPFRVCVKLRFNASKTKKFGNKLLIKLHSIELLEEVLQRRNDTGMLTF